jgi:hypothetical protein
VTPDQQRRALGISAEAEDGHIIISTDRTFMLLTPHEVARFDHFLHVAVHDATVGRERPREIR